jgi:hypothetical protein
MAGGRLDCRAPPCQALKERLIRANHMSLIQKAEKLSDMPDLGARRLSDLLAVIYVYCPSCEEQSVKFRSIFLK